MILSALLIIAGLTDFIPLESTLSKFTPDYVITAGFITIVGAGQAVPAFAAKGRFGFLFSLFVASLYALYMIARLYETITCEGFVSSLGVILIADGICRTAISADLQMPQRRKTLLIGGIVAVIIGITVVILNAKLTIEPLRRNDIPSITEMLVYANFIISGASFLLLSTATPTNRQASTNWDGNP
jgi:uncharacterized membrane protein HdeD (DUF308 family)